MPVTALGKIVIVDNDQSIAALLNVNLSSEGYETTVYNNACDLTPDNVIGARLVVADSMDNEFSGLDLLKALKAHPLTGNIGFIICSTIDSERTIINCLDAGADDYIVKPFSLRELVARVNAVIRRHKRQNIAEPTSVLRFRSLEVDLLTGRVSDGDKVLSLTNTEFSILELLLRNVNNYVSRAEIYKNIWKSDLTKSNERIVDTNISRLRKKLGELSLHLVNRTKLGYMLKSN